MLNKSYVFSVMHGLACACQCSDCRRRSAFTFSESCFSFFLYFTCKLVLTNFLDWKCDHWREIDFL